jgi:hypothetical protein
MWRAVAAPPGERSTQFVLFQLFGGPAACGDGRRPGSRASRGDDVQTCVSQSEEEAKSARGGPPQFDPIAASGLAFAREL